MADVMELVERLRAIQSERNCNGAEPLLTEAADRLLTLEAVADAARAHVTDADMRKATFKLPSYQALYNALAALDKLKEGR